MRVRGEGNICRASNWQGAWGFTISPCFTPRAHVHGREEVPEGQSCLCQPPARAPGKGLSVHLVGGPRPGEVSLSLPSLLLHLSGPPLAGPTMRGATRDLRVEDANQGTKKQKSTTSSPFQGDRRQSIGKPVSFTKLPWQQESAEKLPQTPTS